MPVHMKGISTWLKGRSARYPYCELTKLCNLKIDPRIYIDQLILCDLVKYIFGPYQAVRSFSEYSERHSRHTTHILRAAQDERGNSWG